MLHNYKISVIIDVQHYRSATRCTTIRLIRKVGTKRDKHKRKGKLRFLLLHKFLTFSLIQLSYLISHIVLQRVAEL